MHHFEQFGVSAEDIRATIGAALARGAHDADLYFEHAGSTSVALSDGKVNRASTHVDLGVGVRVVVGDQVGYAYTEDLSRDAMLRAARIAAEIAAGDRTHAPVAAALAQPFADRYPIARPWEQVDLLTRVAMVRDWEQRIFKADPRVIKVETSLGDSFRHILVVRADGKMVADYQPMTRAFVSCTAEQDGKRESASANLAQRMGLEFYTEERVAKLCKRVVDDTMILFDAGKPPAGR